MEIESIAHKALGRFVETGNAKGLPGDLVDRLFKMINFIIDAEDLDELATPPNYGLHLMTGDRWNLVDDPDAKLANDIHDYRGRRDS